MSDQCPDNAIECLLRAILSANSGYNWDPLTFGFTAVFTIIAFIVSLFALIQAFIAAGPGRLKASERAIGSRQHETRADTRFSCKEFRFRTIVSVPVIETSTICDYAPAIIEVQGQGKHEAAPIALKARVVAGWSQLLNDLSLSDIKFHTIECSTDYLPGDVPAAPAWARVETIVLLCVMKGCERLSEDEDGYVGATGYSTQLAWNMHPILGPMAVYRTWDINETSMHSLPDIQTMLPAALGNVKLGGSKIYWLSTLRRNDVPVYFDMSILMPYTEASWERCHHHHAHCIDRKRGLWLTYLASKKTDGDVNKQIAILGCAAFGDKPSKAKAFPSRVTMMHSAIKTMYEEYFPWLILADDLDDHVLTTLCGEDFLEFSELEGMYDVHDLANSKSFSWLPAASGQVKTKIDGDYKLDRPVVNKIPAAKRAGIDDLGKQAYSEDKFQTSRIRISRAAVRFLSRWLSDEDYFTTATKQERLTAKLWLLYQLHELDWFLASMKDDAICAASNLVALGGHKFGVVQFTKLSRRFVMPETLDAFNLRWALNPSDNGSILVKGYLDRETIQKLFNYTRNYITRHRDQLHAVDCPATAQGFYYESRKSFVGSTLNKSISDPLAGRSKGSAEATSTSTSSSDMKEAAEVVTKEELLRDDKVLNKILTSQSETNDAAAASTTSFRKSTDPTGDPEFRKWLLNDRKRIDGGDEVEVEVEVDERIAALEAITFFRAAIFGALLATGTDTSLLLMSEKRYQLVQVQ